MKAVANISGWKSGKGVVYVSMASFNNLNIKPETIEACMPADQDSADWDFSNVKCGGLCADAMDSVFRADVDPNPKNNLRRRQMIQNVQTLGYKTQVRFVNNYNYDWERVRQTQSGTKKSKRRLTKKMKQERALADDDTLPLSKAFKKKYAPRRLQGVGPKNTRTYPPVDGVTEAAMSQENVFQSWHLKLDSKKGNKSTPLETYNDNANLMDLDFSTVMTDSVANEVVPGSGKIFRACVVLALEALALLMNF